MGRITCSSCLFYTGIVLVAIVAALTGWAMHLSQIPDDILIRLDEASASTFHPTTLTPQQIATYEKEGVVFVPGLLPVKESDMLQKTAEFAMNRVFQVASLFGTKLYSSLGFDLWRTSPEVASFALQSLPKTVSPLLSYSTNPQNQVEFRLLRDAMFQYKAGGQGCGWHVDDLGFWPTAEDTDGPTIWIALDEIQVSQGGGLAVINSTLFEELGSVYSSNSTLEMCRKIIVSNTCAMKMLSPECHARMEASKMEWDMKPGDAIIWNRWTFHRGVAAVDENIDPDTFVKRRYSVRYTPYGSRAGPFMIHPSVGEGNLLDSSPYYPRVWPSLLEEEVAAIEHGLEADAQILRTLKLVVKLIYIKLFSPEELS